jgi:uncharacterized protein
MSIKGIEDIIKSSNKKYADLISWFEVKNSKVIVALSGGVDSALVAFAARQALGKDRVLAITANYKTLATEELDSAIKVAREIDVKHLMIQYNELENPQFVKNDMTRCYHCRNELADHLLKLAKDKKFDMVVDGSQMDDLSEYRPGMIALEKKGIKSPLIENGLSKKEVRFLAKTNNISIYDKPSNSCLASRIPHGFEVTYFKLNRIEKSELTIKNKIGLNHVRVRDHGDIARIELNKDDFVKLFEYQEDLDQILKSMHQYGFKYITLDLEGYRNNKQEV